MRKQERLSERVAIITGGAGGIGAATGLLFAEEGARVALVDSDAEAMGAAIAEIRAAVPSARIVDIVTDVSREDAAVAAGQHGAPRARRNRRAGQPRRHSRLRVDR